jgi:hypothetical protein
MAILVIVQPKNDDVDEDGTNDKVFPQEKYAQNQPIIPVSSELSEPFFGWTDNKSLMIVAFPDKYVFGQGVLNGLKSTKMETFFTLL